MQRQTIRIIPIFASLMLAPLAHAFDGIVEKNVFPTPSFATRSTPTGTSSEQPLHGPLNR